MRHRVRHEAVIAAVLCLAVATAKADQAMDEQAAIETILATLGQLEHERAQEASRPLDQQRRAVYERLRDQASTLLADVDRRWISGDPRVNQVRGPLWEYLANVGAHLFKLEGHERAV